MPEYDALAIGSTANSFPVISLILESQAQGIHGKEENEGERHHDPPISTLAHHCHMHPLTREMTGNEKGRAGQSFKKQGSLKQCNT